MSRLLENSDEFRNENMTRNKFKKDDVYEVGHDNALSDGDAWGKGENNGQIGNDTDISKRSSLLTKNLYSKNNEYNAGTV
ncbi:MAG: hypothetical protein ACOC2W_04700 [bacterium]